jgi:hypothetical protein
MLVWVREACDIRQLEARRMSKLPNGREEWGLGSNAVEFCCSQRYSFVAKVPEGSIRTVTAAQLSPQSALRFLITSYDSQAWAFPRSKSIFAARPQTPSMTPSPEKIRSCNSRP